MHGTSTDTDTKHPHPQSECCRGPSGSILPHSLLIVESFGMVPMACAMTVHVSCMQRKNARAMERLGAARVLDETELTPECLRSAIDGILGDKRQR